MSATLWYILAAVAILYGIAAFLLGLWPLRCRPVGPPRAITTAGPRGLTFWNRLVARYRRTRICREFRRQLLSDAAVSAFTATPPNDFTFRVAGIDRGGLDLVIDEFLDYDFAVTDLGRQRWELVVTLR